jgi:predicted DNA-binding ribbon-helix-helix protein
VRTGRVDLQKELDMKSAIVKHSIAIGGHKTSVSLEDPFWSELKEIANGQHLTLSNMVAGIDKSRQQGNLSSAIRLFVLQQLRAQAMPFAARQDDFGADHYLIRGSSHGHA